jgi:hypothetical protein
MIQAHAIQAQQTQAQMIQAHAIQARMIQAQQIRAPGSQARAVGMAQAIETRAGRPSPTRRDRAGRTYRFPVMLLLLAVLRAGPAQQPTLGGPPESGDRPRRNPAHGC